MSTDSDTQDRFAGLEDAWPGEWVPAKSERCLEDAPTGWSVYAYRVEETRLLDAIETVRDITYTGAGSTFTEAKSDLLERISSRAATMNAFLSWAK